MERVRTTRAIGKSMQIIYQPKGKAGEYARWACNPWVGCTNGCHYCYAKHMARKPAAEFHAAPTPRKEWLPNFWADCQTLSENREQDVIFFSFLCDPFESGHDQWGVYSAIGYALQTGNGIRVLTKKPSNVKWGCILGEIDFGVSLTGAPPTIEPRADDPWTRFKALILAKELGHTTWVSMEPVWNVEACLAMIEAIEIKDCVDRWRIGKLNGYDSVTRDHEASIGPNGWRKLVKGVKERIPEDKFVLKDGLKEFGE